MSSYKKIALTLDNTEVDISVLQACKNFISLYDEFPELHIIHARNLSKKDIQNIAFLDDYLELDAITENNIHTKLMGKVSKIFGKEFKEKTFLHILKGSALEEILQFHNHFEMDIFFVGKKKDVKSSGRVAKELIRRANVPVMVIPETFDKSWQFKDILVPYDFSENSDRALLIADSLKQTIPDSKIECFYVVDFPMYKSDVAISIDKVMNTIKESRTEEFESRINELKLKHKPSFYIHVNHGEYIATDILKRSLTGNFSLCVIGAKGHTLIERFFIGSVTERIIALVNKVPLLIIK